MQYVDDAVLPQLVPRLTELIRAGVGLGTKVSHSLVHNVLMHQVLVILCALTVTSSVVHICCLTSLTVGIYGLISAAKLCKPVLLII